jgi:uncharacterized protein (DUF1778 family)
MSAPRREVPHDVLQAKRPAPWYGCARRTCARSQEADLDKGGRIGNILILMRTKRLQIPVSDQECSRFQSAARRAGLSLSEWARRQLREKAEETLGGAILGPREALALIKSLDAPIAPVEVMMEESVSGRYS